MEHRILVVDDTASICEVLELNLQNEGYMVDCASSAEEAFKKLTAEHSLILLDVMMGGISGYEMARRLREEKNAIPIIFLTAKDGENDMLTGFSAGGDDYISKPFSIKEVLVRVKAVLKRSETKGKEGPTNVNITPDIIINTEAKEFSVKGKNMALTRTEFEIIRLLASKPDRVFEREEIIDTVWHDTPYITERTVDVHIGRLRKKLGNYAALITSRAGYGYRFNKQAIEEQ